jgi:hypothetical protein
MRPGRSRRHRVCLSRSAPDPESAMRQTTHINAPSEHALFLRLFVSNGGGW